MRLKFLKVKQWLLGTPEADLDAIRAAGREISTIVAFTNADAIKLVKVEH